MVSDDKKENAVIRRVGIWVGLMVALCQASSAAAETIPFDYWYGKIIGRTQIRSIHDAYNDETGVLTTNVKVGHGDDVSVGLGDLFYIEPTSQSNALQLHFGRPQLTSSAAVGARTRWEIAKLDWQDHSDFRPDGDDLELNNQSSFMSNQSIRMLHKDIEYDAERSLYYYTSGMLLQPRNWKLDVNLTVNVADWFSEDLFSYSGATSADTIVSHSKQEIDNRYWLINSGLGYGVSRKLQLTLGWTVGRRSNPWDETYKRWRKSEPDSSLVNRSYKQLTVDRDYEAFVEPLYLFSNRHWASLRASYNGQSTNGRSQDYDGFDYTNPSPGVMRYAVQMHVYGLAANHTWISKNAHIQREQILDDHSSYYGHRLEPGSFRLSSAIDLWFLRRTSQGWEERDGLNWNYTSPSYRRENVLRVSSELKYFSFLDIDLSARFTLNRQSRASGHTRVIRNSTHEQTYKFQFELAYYSYRWDANERKEIGWDKVNDMDYLYGPLLRPRDFRVSLVIEPPEHEWTAVLDNQNIFKFFKGESNNRWFGRLTGGIGVSDGVEAGFDANYQQDMTIEDYFPPYFDNFRSDTWYVTPKLRWQPGQRFRLEFSVTETYRDTKYTSSQLGENRQVHEYRHTWRLYTVYTILI